MAYRAITLEKRQHVAFITLARPEVGNAIDKQMASEVREACLEAHTDDEVRVVVLQALGESFCRGSSLCLPTPGDRVSVDEARQVLGDHRAAAAIGNITKPVIAAIHGDAFDQGLELALACDLRIATVGIHLGFPQTTGGTLPWDGGTQRLLRVAGASRAMDLLLTKRLVGTDEAHAMGLINQIVGPRDLTQRVEELASTITQGAPIAARYVKETVLRGLDISLQEGLRLEADLNFLLFSTADRAEGIRSFLERGKPQFRGE